MANTSDAPLLTTREVAARLKVGPETIRKYAKEGTLKGYRLGTGLRQTWRFSEDSLAQFISAQKGTAETGEK